MSFTGKLLYHAWHRPAGYIRDLASAGGPVGRRLTERGRQEMEDAARHLPPPPAGVALPVELHVLTGKRFWFQTAFCLWTFAAHSGRRLEPVIHDDGTLDPDQRTTLGQLFPGARFIEKATALARLDQLLPSSQFPTLRERWTNYPNIRKLIDPHLGETGWKLAVDSDLLFFRRPDFILRWLDDSGRPLVAEDCTTSYGYGREMLEKLAGARLADRVNVGLCGLNSSELDWQRIEFWCRQLIERSGSHYFLEQAIVAMLVAGRECAVSPSADYVTGPRPPESLECRAVMHHYVATSKRWYFRHNWRQAMQSAESALAAC